MALQIRQDPRRLTGVFVCTLGVLHRLAEHAHQPCIAGQPQHVVTTVVFTPVHDRVAAERCSCSSPAPENEAPPHIDLAVVDDRQGDRICQQ